MRGGRGGGWGLAAKPGINQSVRFHHAPLTRTTLTTTTRRRRRRRAERLVETTRHEAGKVDE